MFTKPWFMAIGIIIILAVGINIFRDDKSIQSSTRSDGDPIVSAEEVFRNPALFTGHLRVAGIVTHVDETQSAFTLGCEDACILMPVKFSGQPPKEGTNVIAYGELKKTEQAKYIFVAKEIEAK